MQTIRDQQASGRVEICNSISGTLISALEEVGAEGYMVGAKSQVGCIQFYLGRSIRFQLTHEHTSLLTFPPCSAQDLSGIVPEF